MLLSGKNFCFEDSATSCTWRQRREVVSSLDIGSAPQMGSRALEQDIFEYVIKGVCNLLRDMTCQNLSCGMMRLFETVTKMYLVFLTLYVYV